MMLIPGDDINGSTQDGTLFPPDFLTSTPFAFVFQHYNQRVIC